MPAYDGRYPAIADVARLARRRIPRFAFDYLDGGALDGAAVRRNRTALSRITIMPRHLVTEEDVDISARLFDRRFAMPIGVAPVGLGNLFWPGAELALARMARARDVPFVLSTLGTTSIEEIGTVAGDNAWFQLYPTRDPEIGLDLVRRARTAGFGALIVTVDVPAGGKRNRDLRNDLAVPFRLTPSLMAQVLARPRWALATLRAGAPAFVNLMPYAGAAGSPAAALQGFVSGLIASRPGRELIGRLRAAWPGPLFIKGILAPADAVAARALGADGIIVSNHGGRQFDAAPAAIDMLPAVRQVLGEDYPILFDSGVRDGADIVRARARGADFVLAGRAFYYGLAALGAPGADQVIALLEDELRLCLLQAGCPSFRRFGAGWLAPAAEHAHIAVDGCAATT